jgi:hypothetical protein
LVEDMKKEAEDKRLKKEKDEEEAERVQCYCFLIFQYSKTCEKHLSLGPKNINCSGCFVSVLLMLNVK